MAEIFFTKELFSAASNTAVIDVRTPAEYNVGHIPGAHNIPLFSDEERAVVGTLYKQQGREAAILRGLDLVGVKTRNILEQIIAVANGKELLIHCWRGGMRSSSVVWLAKLYGFNCTQLIGGYKAYRNEVLNSFLNIYNLNILGGKTGSRKTEVLHHLNYRGKQVLDLEGLAHHKGSAFGAIGEAEQPTQEQFENDIHKQLISFVATQPIWLEDESRTIGKKVIPLGIWEQMRTSNVFYIDAPVETRTEYLVSTYGKYPKEVLAASIEKIQKKLGGLEYQNAKQFLEAGDYHSTCKLLLYYYDKTYEQGLQKRNPDSVVKVVSPHFSVEEISEILLAQS